MKKNLLLGSLFLLTLGACTKETVTPQAPKTNVKAHARVAGDNYDRSDVLSIVKRANELNPKHCTPAARLVAVKVACWTLYCNDGYRIDYYNGSYGCSMANSLCDIEKVVYSGMATVQDPKGGNTPVEEYWNNVEVLKAGDVIVCTDGDPTYYEGAHVEIASDGSHRIVKN
ncbi:hypothetical protein ACTHGU_13550 [Chitinophagaceae bacterium MMS25-I14]